MKHIRSRIPVLITLILLIFGAIGTTPVYAAGYIVTKTADTNDSVCDADCSLREALAAANASPGADTITFDPALSGATINLDSTLIPTDDVTIDGSALATQVTISGDSTPTDGTGDVQVFYINSDGITVIFNSLIITKGNVMDVDVGGGVFVDSATLTIINSTFTDNAAADGGAIYNSASTLTITNSAFTNNAAIDGGAIFNNAGTVTITNSTFNANNAMFGGAIDNEGTLNISNSTFSNNTATLDGGSIFNFGDLTILTSTLMDNIASNSGGAIYHNGGTLLASNSTFSDNNAAGVEGSGGGIINDSGDTLTIFNSTFSGNSASQGGGIFNSFGTLNYANVIIANSTGGDCFNTDSIGTNTSNLVEDTSCSAAGGTPNLGPLGNYGGLTQTFALLAGSSAIDAGDVTTCADPTVNNFDQRGVTRPQGAQCDIGAYEYVPVVSTATPTVTSTVTTTSTPTTTVTVTKTVTPTLTITQTTTQTAIATATTTRTSTVTPTFTPSPTLTATITKTSTATSTLVPVSVTINQAAGQLDPTTVAPIHFTAVFSEGVTGFTGSDISFTGTTLTGTLTATITEIAPNNGTTYDVAITGMIPLGTVMVNIPAGRVTSISRPTVPNKASTSSDAQVTFDYILVEFGANSANDGWVLESTETSGLGGSLNSTASTTSVGDNASDRQYRTVLDFATDSLPDNAVVSIVNLRIIQASIGGTNPFTTHGALKAEIKTNFFGTTAALQKADFEAAFDKLACNFGAVPEMIESLGPAYRCIVGATARPKINRTGHTQFRLRFTLDDNDDLSADTFNFYSGNFYNWSQRPRLFIKYYIPPVP